MIPDEHEEDYSWQLSHLILKNTQMWLSSGSVLPLCGAECGRLRGIWTHILALFFILGIALCIEWINEFGFFSYLRGFYSAHIGTRPLSASPSLMRHP